jgi:hypothetical protein
MEENDEEEDEEEDLDGEVSESDDNGTTDVR